ncbi:MAG: DUF3107 domain-containing protein [Arachnia sp.]
MEVKIGVSEIGREVTVKTEQSVDELNSALKSALESGGLFEVTGEQGRRVVIPSGKIGYVEFGAADARPVGFGTV